MATTYVDTTASGGQTDFEFTFPYLEDEHVKVEINGVATTAFTISTTPTQKVVLDSGATAGDQVRVRRRSAPNQNLVDFVNGSVLTESELDLAYRHNRYLAEEIAELNDASLQIEAGGTQWDAKDLRIKNVATPTDTTDAPNKLYVDNKVNQLVYGSSEAPLKWQFTGLAGANGTYTVTGAEVQGDTAYDVSIDGLVKEPGVDFTVDPDTDTLTIVPTLVGGEDIVVIQRGFGVAITATIGTNSLADGSVTSDKISTTDTKFNVQSNGNVGIGTSNPNLAKLQIRGDNDLLRLTSTRDGTGGAEIALVHDSASPAENDSVGLINFIGLNIDGDLVTWASIRGVHGDFTNKGGDITFSTRLGNDFEEGMRITHDGNVGIGTATPAYALDVDGDINITGDYKVNGTNLQTVPTGTVSAFAGSAAPTGYLLCDGTAVNRTTYATLFGVISTTYGVGDGSTTFNLPDLRGRVVAGMGGSLLSGTDAVADTGGASTHTLLEAEMPSHTHFTLQSDSGTSANGVSTTNAAAAATSFGDDFSYSMRAPTGEPAADVNLSSETGSDNAHNNVQPTIILNYIIKI